MEGRGNIFVLLDVHLVVFNQDNSAFVVVLVTVVWRTEDGDHRGERGVAAPTVHFVPVWLDLMRADDRDKVVFLQDFFDRLESELD